jgi:hypothetical protein
MGELMACTTAICTLGSDEMSTPDVTAPAWNVAPARSTVSVGDHELHVRMARNGVEKPIPDALDALLLLLQPRLRSAVQHRRLLRERIIDRRGAARPRR